MVCVSYCSAATTSRRFTACALWCVVVCVKRKHKQRVNPKTDCGAGWVFRGSDRNGE